MLILVIFLSGVGTALLACLLGGFNIVGGFRGIYEGCCVNKISPEDDEDSGEEGGAHACIPKSFLRAHLFLSVQATHARRNHPHTHPHAPHDRHRGRAGEQARMSAGGGGGE